MANIILTSPQGIVGIPGTTTLNVNIPGVGSAPNNIVIVDQSDYLSVKWIYTLIDSVADQILIAEVMAAQYAGSPTGPNYNQYGLVGHPIKHTIEIKQ